MSATLRLGRRVFKDEVAHWCTDLNETLSIIHTLANPPDADGGLGGYLDYKLAGFIDTRPLRSETARKLDLVVASFDAFFKAHIKNSVGQDSEWVARDFEKFSARIIKTMSAALVCTLRDMKDDDMLTRERAAGEMRPLERAIAIASRIHGETMACSGTWYHVHSDTSRGWWFWPPKSDAPAVVKKESLKENI